MDRFRQKPKSSHEFIVEITSPRLLAQVSEVTPKIEQILANFGGLAFITN